MKSQKTQKKSKKRVAYKRLAINLPVLLVVVATGVLSAYIAVHQLSRDSESGLLSDEQKKSTQPAQSLDLSVAAKAVYPSSAITVVQDFGKVDGVREQIISFGVPTDNLTEYGLMMLPSTPPPASGYPVVILCHGYYNPEAYKTTSGYIADMEVYAKAGYAVVKPDLRGQGLSLHQGEPVGAYYSMGYNTDVISLISAIKKTSKLDETRISIWGHSMGAYIALRAAVVSKDIKNVILLSGPVDSLKEMYLTYLPPSDVNNPEALQAAQVVFRKYGTPAQNPDFWDKTSPINYVSKINAHIQIYVGLQDRIVPPKFSADLNAALNKAHEAHEYYAYPAGEHGLIEQRGEIWSKTLKLMGKVNRPSV